MEYIIDKDLITENQKIMLSPELKDALLKTPLCQDLNQQELEMLISHNPLITFSPGEIILDQGKSSPGMYIILDGTCLVTAKILGEGGTYITTLGHGNLLGEVGLIEKGEVSPTSVIASTIVQCILVTNIYFAMLGLIFPETKYKITYAIVKDVCNRLFDLHEKISNFITQTDMTSRSMLSEVIKSLTKYSIISLPETGMSINEIQKRTPFDTFSTDEIDYLLKHATFIKAPKHCPLIVAGEKATAIFIVLKGAVLSSIVQDNKAAKLYVFGPTGLFAPITIIDEASPAILNYTTCERAVLLKIPESEITQIRKHNIELWYKLFNLICEAFVILKQAANKLDVRLNSESYNR